MVQCQFNCLILFACLCLTGCGPPELHDATPKYAVGAPESIAKERLRAFLVALQQQDQQAVLREIDVPYFNDHRFEVIKDRAELERRYDDVFKPWTDAGPLPSWLTSIHRYGEDRDLMREGVQRQLDQVLAADDFIFRLGKISEEKRFVLVRMKDGVAKVVGVTTE